MQRPVALAVLALVVATGCPRAQQPDSGATPAPTTPPVPPTPTSPSPAATPEGEGGVPPDPNADYYSERNGDGADNPLVPGCHYFYGKDPQCQLQNEVFYKGDWCSSPNILEEYTSPACHPFPPSCRVQHDCKKEFGGTCVTVPNHCGAGRPSSHCTVDATAFHECAQPACAMKCDAEGRASKEVLCKQGGSAKAAPTSYACCCCGTSGNSFKFLAQKKYPGETAGASEPAPKGKD
jgi:hypothetical protein